MVHRMATKRRIGFRDFIIIGLAVLSLSLLSMMGPAYDAYMTLQSWKMDNYTNLIEEVNTSWIRNHVFLTCLQPNITISEKQCPACPDCIHVDQPLPELPLFMQEAKNVAGAHYYETGKYVCQGYAKELTRRLVADGYDAQYCIGTARWCERNQEFDNQNCRHAWVKLGENVYIEATTGRFIEPKDYALDYREERCWNPF